MYLKPVIAAPRSQAGTLRNRDQPGLSSKIVSKTYGVGKLVVQIVLVLCAYPVPIKNILGVRFGGSCL